MQIKESTPNRARLFFALWPSLAVRRKLHEIALQHLDQCGGRPTRAATLHITLLFLGIVERARLEPLMQAAARVSLPPFAFRLQRFACWQHNRIGFAAPETEVNELKMLTEALQQAMTLAGFEFDRRNFVPHVTLLRKIIHPLAAQSLAPIEWRVKEFMLVESVTGEQGVTYKTLATWPLE